MKGAASEKAGSRATGMLSWPLAFAILITLIGFACLVRLARTGTVPWTAVAIMLPVLFTVTPLLCGVGLRARYSLASESTSFWSIVLVAIAALLSLLGFLTRLSLGEKGWAAGSQPLAAVLGVIALAVTGELALSYPPVWLADNPADGATPGTSRWRRILLIAATVFVVVGVQYFARPGQQVVRSGARSPWPVPVITVIYLALLATVLASPRSGLVTVKQRSWLQDRTVLSFARHALPVAAALAVFAYTRDLGAGILVLAGGLGVLIRADRMYISAVSVGRPWHARSGIGPAQAAEPVRPVLARRFGPPLASLAVFAVGVWVITLLATALWSPDFSPSHVYGADQSFPYALAPGPSVLVGLGFPYRQVGPLGGNAELLVVIGRETGVIGLAGVLALLLALLAVLFWLAKPDPVRPVRSSLAYGLTWLLCAQALLAALALLHWTPPLGPGPPLLAGGASWYVTALVTIGLVIGLAWREPGTRRRYHVGNGTTRNLQHAR